MSKKYAILGAGLVASGRSLSTTSISNQRGDSPKHAPPVETGPFFDGNDFALAELGRDPWMRPVGPAADPVDRAR